MNSLPNEILSLFRTTQEEIVDSTKQWFRNTESTSYESAIIKLTVTGERRPEIVCLPTSRIEIFTHKNNEGSWVALSEGFIYWLECIAQNITMSTILVSSEMLNSKSRDEMMGALHGAQMLYTLYEDNQFPQLLSQVNFRNYPLYIITREIILLFTIFHELTHLNYAHFDQEKNTKHFEFEADLGAVKLLTNIKVPPTWISVFVSQFLAALYYRFLIHRIDLRAHPTYLERVTNILSIFPDNITFDKEGELLTAAMADIEKFGVFYGDYDYQSDDYRRTACSNTISNYQSIDTLYGQDVSVREFVKRSFEVYENITSNVLNIDFKT